ncbi:hypothetical protein R80B4_03256 [Fibrobacteres bacterium R8-0-B4]
MTSFLNEDVAFSTYKIVFGEMDKAKFIVGTAIGRPTNPSAARPRDERGRRGGSGRPLFVGARTPCLDRKIFY